MKTSFLETIKILDGEVYNLEHHQKRYESVLSHFGISSFEKLSLFITPPSHGLYRCRLGYSLDSTIEVTYLPYEKKNTQTLKLVSDDSIDYKFKYENRDSINKLYDKRDGCDDILIIKNGYVTDTSIANIAFFDGSSWLTPSQPLLCGTTRERLLKSGDIIKADIQVKDLNRFSRIALLNAMIDFDIITNISYVD